MPSPPASSRRGSRALIEELDTGHARWACLRVEARFKHTLSVGERVRRIEVLPLAFTDLHRAEPPFICQLPHAVGERTISILGCRLQPLKQRGSAKEHSRIERVVAWDFLANVGDEIAEAPYL